LATCALLLAAASHAATPGAAQVWVTTADQSRLLAREPEVAFAAQAPLATRIDVDPERRYQQMVGFGAAITDSSAWLIDKRLRAAPRAALLQELFGRDGGF